MQEKDHKPSDEFDQENEDELEHDVKKMAPHERKMIRGFMRGFGKIIILWLVSKKRQHGYEIMTHLQQASTVNKMPSTSMIYPVLHALEKLGMIEGTWEYHGKRKVKYYEITEEGEESLERIRKLISKGKEMGRTNLYQAFMEDMFSLKPMN